MKVLVDASVLEIPRTGVGNVLLGLYKACLKQDPELDVHFLHRAPLHAALDQPIQSIHRGQWLNAHHWRKMWLPLEAMFFPIIHFPWNGNIPKLWKHATVVTTFHDVLPLIIPGFFNDERAEARYRQGVQSDLDRTDLLLTDSYFSRDEILRNFRVNRDPVVMYPATILSENLQNHNEAYFTQAQYFIYVGGYDKRKGLEPLLKIFLATRALGKLKSRLLLVGQPSSVSSEFDHFLKQGKETAAIEELGYVDDARLASLLRGALALVYLSKYEGFGLPPLEAMACGCPVVTTRFTSIPEACEDAALYVNPDNEKEIADALIEIESNGSLRANLRTQGKRRAELFSWEKSAELFIRALSSVTSSMVSKR